MNDSEQNVVSAPEPVHPANIQAVSIKLPPFWPKDPLVWFAQVEAQFSTRNITNQKTKFDYIVSSLSPEIAFEVRELLLAPPLQNPYDQLKTELVKRVSDSEQRRLQQLLAEEHLGDFKPTQLLRRMQQLTDESTIDSSIFKELFLRRLPANIRLVLAGIGNKLSIQEQAELADKMLDATPPAIVSAVKSDKHELTNLTEMIQALQAEVTQLRLSRERDRPSAFCHRTSSRQRRSSQSADASSRNPDYCWFHQTFGSQARKCQNPCKFVALNSNSSR